MPEIGVAMPSERDRPRLSPRTYAGVTDSRTGVEATLWGALGVKLGWVEGFELNCSAWWPGSICAIRD